MNFGMFAMAMVVLFILFAHEPGDPSLYDMVIHYLEVVTTAEELRTLGAAREL